jgi:hypothetical protein
VFDRLKRILLAMPRDAVLPTPLAPGPLDWIDETTPYRFRTWLPERGQREAAIETLERRLGRELAVTATDEPDGRVRLDLVSTFDGLAGIHRPLHVLRRAGIRVHDLEYLDRSDDLSPTELGRLAAAWEARSYDRAIRRRIDALAGEATLRTAIAASRGTREGSGWRMIVSRAAAFTPDVDAMLLEAAIAERDPALAKFTAGMVGGRGEIAELVSMPFSPPIELVVGVARRGGEAAEAAYRIAVFLPAPLPADLTTVLCKAARRGVEGSFDAVRALRRATPSDEVRTALEGALASSILDVADAALNTLAEVFGVSARQYWQAGLASRSAPLRMAAEDVIGAYGDADDVPRAAEHLGKIIRRRSTTSWEPPRGSAIIELLVRHRELPESQAALVDLRKRWVRLPDGLQQWLRQHHPDLVPAEPSLPSPDASPEVVEPPLEWPLPSMERKGRELHLGFWDTDVTDIRDQFGDLIEAHPSVTILDGDREWLTLRIDAPDPEQVVAELWSEAHRRGADD